MRFRPEQHLRRPAEIRSVREQGRRIDCRSFTLWWKRRAVTPPYHLPSNTRRVCVIASTAAVGGAIQRNRAKRRLREVFRNQQPQVPAGCDLLLIARAAVNGRSMAELQHRFAEACRQMAAALAVPDS